MSLAISLLLYLTIVSQPLMSVTTEDASNPHRYAYL